MNQKSQAKAPPAAKTAVAVAAKNEVTTVDAGDFSGEQYVAPKLDSADLAIPFWSILQSNSPQVKRSEGAYIDGAQEGFLFNNVTNQVYDPNDPEHPFLFVVCGYKRSLVEWRIREKGGGFVAEHPVNPALQQSTTRDEKNRDILPNGNQLNDTRTYYIMTLDPELGPMPGVLAMTSTQIKKARQLATQLNMLRLKGANGPYCPPWHASKMQMTTVPESNEKGSWMGWAWEHAGYFSSAQDPEYLACKEFNKQIMEGAVKVDMSRMQEIDPDTGEIRNAGDGASADNPEF